MSNALIKTLNLIIQNASKDLKNGTSAPQNAVYNVNDTLNDTLLNTIRVIKSSIPTNYIMNNTHYADKTVFYFCFMIEDASRVKQMFGKDKQYSYTLQLYKNGNTPPMIYKIGFTNNNILGVKQEKRVFGDNNLDATRLMKETLSITTTFKNESLASLNNLLHENEPIQDEKVNLYKMLIGIMERNSTIRFIPIVPPKPENVGGYRKTYKRYRRSKCTRKHKRRLH
jgi:hypothetical protein